MARPWRFHPAAIFRRSIALGRRRRLSFLRTIARGRGEAPEQPTKDLDRATCGSSADSVAQRTEGMLSFACRSEPNGCRQGNRSVCCPGYQGCDGCSNRLFQPTSWEIVEFLKCILRSSTATFMTIRLNSLGRTRRRALHRSVVLLVYQEDLTCFGSFSGYF